MPTLLQPDAQEKLDQDPTDLAHWVCLTIKSHPYIGLCGHLTNGEQCGTEIPMCPDCLERSVRHGQSCWRCHAWVGML